MANDFVKQNFANNQAKLGASLVTLAYNYAKTMDPSGRISERDFQAALKAVQGTRQPTSGHDLALIRDIIRETPVKNLSTMKRCLGSSPQGQADNTRYRLSKPHLQRMQALTHYRPLLRVSRGLEDVRRYKRYLKCINGPVFAQPNVTFADKNMAAEFSIDIVDAEAILWDLRQLSAQHGQQRFSLAEQYNLGILKLGPRSSSRVNPLVDIPIFVDTRTGKIVSRAQVSQLIGRRI